MQKMSTKFFILVLLAALVWPVSWQAALADATPAGSSAISVTRGPYLQLGTPSSIVVRWRTANQTDSRVRYGTDPANLSQIVDMAGSTIEHEVVLDNLAPQTKYYYAVGNSADDLSTSADYYFITAPPEGTRKSVRVWILGDSGTGNQNAKDVRDAYYAFTGQRHTDLWVMVGDNAYSDGTDDEYQENMFEIYPTMLSKSVLWPAFGNHDGKSADSNDESGVFYDIFTLPRQAEAGGAPSNTEAFYSFNFANIHFICLNSHDVDRSQNGEMLQWLEKDLAENKLDWTIAYWHHPPYTKGSHDSDDDGRSIDMRENALPILENGGVDVVFSGHSHSYERSYLIDGHYGKSSSLSGNMILDNGNGKADGDGGYRKPTLGPAPHEGTIYVVAGSSGKTGGGSLDHPVMHFSISKLGSVVLDVNTDRLDLTFLDNQGNRLDYFTMTKGDGVVSIAGTQVSSLAAQGADGTVTLTWSTLREVNTAGFEVFRATASGGEYQRVRSYRDSEALKGAGNADHPLSYHFTDQNLVNGQEYWYKIDVVGIAGERATYGPIRVTPTSLAVSPLDGVVPQSLVLHQNYPNPFNPSTTVRFDLPAGDVPFYDVQLEIFDVRGQRVKTLLKGKYAPGSYALQWDGTGERGDRVPSGIYIYRLITPDFRQAHKMILTR